ncbi:MAG: SIMPL domain-containing protein [Propionivibrio sp.]
MTHAFRRLTALPLLAVFLAVPLAAAQPVIELSAEASRPAANDLIRATVLAEATGATPGELSKQINGQIAEALKTAKAYPSVKTKSGNTSSYPVYSKGGKIESWRMRSELVLESGDTAAISELLGKLQDALGVANLALMSSPETRKAVENEAILDAIAAFKARATLIAGSMEKSYHIKQLNVSTNGRVEPPMFRAAARSMSAEAMPMPVESGESQISAMVSGQIELE